MRVNENAKDIACSVAGSARKVLFELQVEQHHHDETYHREIARLSLHHRLNHMALHFAKYAGKIAIANNEQALVAVHIDIIIIALSTTNILNVQLWNILEHGDREFPGLVPFGRELATRLQKVLKDRAELLRENAIATGRIAAACEKIDHLEDISFRTEIVAGVRQLAMLSIAFLALQGVDPAEAVRQRLRGVKERLVLHGRV